MLCSSCIFKLPFFSLFPFAPSRFHWLPIRYLKLMEEASLDDPRSTDAVGGWRWKKQTTRQSANQCRAFSPNTALHRTRLVGKFHRRGVLQILWLLQDHSHHKNVCCWVKLLSWSLGDSSPKGEVSLIYRFVHLLSQLPVSLKSIQHYW